MLPFQWSEFNVFAIIHKYISIIHIAYILYYIVYNVYNYIVIYTKKYN